MNETVSFTCYAWIRRLGRVGLLTRFCSLGSAPLVEGQYDRGAGRKKVLSRTPALRLQTVIPDIAKVTAPAEKVRS